MKEKENKDKAKKKEKLKEVIMASSDDEKSMKGEGEDVHE